MASHQVAGSTGAATPGPTLRDSFAPERWRLQTRAVSPEWTDYNGHMNVAYYGVAFEAALDLFLDAVDLGAAYVAREGMGPFTLQMHNHFLAELKEGERFAVDLLMLGGDAKRWHFMAMMMRLDDAESSLSGDVDETLAATTEQIVMNVDLNQRRAAPLPTPQAGRLKALAEAHAGLPRPIQVGAPLGLRRPG